MQPRTAEQIEGWPTQPFSGGYGGLHELAAANFSGAVSANGAWLFMLNGHAIGVVEGTIETFDGASGTAYTAPDDSLPLLFAMFELGGEKRGQYYTERTSLSEVHKTLAQGGFTGYVELSENVLSGDYYVVYYGGNAMYAAFVGQAERLLTGEDAAARTTDEVGLYDVVAVDLSILELPDSTEAGNEAVGVTTPTSNGVTGESTANEQSHESGEHRPAATPDDLDLESTLTGGREASSSPDSPPDESVPIEGAQSPERSESTPEPDDSEGDDSGDDRTTPIGDSTDEAVAASLDDVDLDDAPADDGPPDGSAGRPETPDRETDDAHETSDEPTPPTEATDLTPAVSEVATDEATASLETDSEESVEGESVEDERLDEERSDHETETSAFDDLFTKYEHAETDEEFASVVTDPSEGGRVDDERLSELEAENRRLGDERDELANERDRLASRIDELEASVAASTPPADFEQVTPEAALAATDLFVRYQSRSAETLDAAHQGADNREAVRGNLDLEHHTRFDAARTAVGDEAFEQFLPTTLEHRLVTWLVTDLLYEIRDTGHLEGLRPLYDALPRIDRADLHGAVEVDAGEDSVSFDVVCRDRLGTPLVCLDVHDSRDPATDAEMRSVLEKSGRVGEDHDDFACAFLVTSSFFEPSALEVATEKTASGGLFGGSRRESFVRLSRKRGFHLCLVEARDRRFHLTMPEL